MTVRRSWTQLSKLGFSRSRVIGLLRTFGGAGHATKRGIEVSRADYYRLMGALYRHG